MWYVDTNVWVRLFTVGDEDVQARCRALIDDCVEGRIGLAVHAATLAELVFVLGSKRIYGQPRDLVADVIQTVLNIRNLDVEGRAEVELASRLYRGSNLDFADCYAAAVARHQGMDGVISFDKGLDKLPDVVRREP
jgi:predicted nucleic-acid-binding protein